ncbi:AbrB family transcriptional regulator [Rhodoblastus acidophilus]|uniref:AbrB family transcriptional regulator n=1 Tax=Rhodoblastus acidophilus TaxID=1074 RepID=A0A6N8DPV5_RHOAC|nr:AbrB/MazE/SpoVT family DNA-binding domain-containing protein [Rhodoblastus acidophilus]MCW2274314.1 AbrB family looped-hinge helix DNA binding protein [Rhodoblastus acidophilus]MTV31233.1 AbrB family transcriptional regulator [Rhodoblastus acidophilus]
MSERLTTTVSTKGQVILPKAVREHRNWPAGTRLVVEEVGDGVLLKRAPLFETTQMSDVFACLKTDGRARAVEEMDAAILAEARKHAGD